LTRLVEEHKGVPQAAIKLDLRTANRSLPKDLEQSAGAPSPTPATRRVVIGDL